MVEKLEDAKGGRKEKTVSYASIIRMAIDTVHGAPADARWICRIETAFYDGLSGATNQNCNLCTWKV